MEGERGGCKGELRAVGVGVSERCFGQVWACEGPGARANRPPSQNLLICDPVICFPSHLPVVLAPRRALSAKEAPQLQRASLEYICAEGGSRVIQPSFQAEQTKLCGGRGQRRSASARSGLTMTICRPRCEPDDCHNRQVGLSLSTALTEESREARRLNTYKQLWGYLKL